MPSTRKRVIKTVYKDEEDSDAGETGDFSDSGSEAKISDAGSSSDEEEGEPEVSSGDEFKKVPSRRTVPKQTKKIPTVRKSFAKEFISKIKQNMAGSDEESPPEKLPLFSVKDLTEADKLLPACLNLSESDSSDDDESPKPIASRQSLPSTSNVNKVYQSDSETETKTEYKDVWSENQQDNSEEVAKRAFQELEKHKSKIEETKANIAKYKSTHNTSKELDVKELLAQGEEEVPVPEAVKKNVSRRKKKEESESEVEDWEEVNEAKTIPQQGLQLFVDFPDGARKSKKLDAEMMMKRKINRVKKEYQVYMHKVHVLCWLAHGNYVSKVLNDPDVLAAVLTLVPSKECYPGERIDMKYVEQITTWYKDKLTLKQDKNEDKYKPKAPPLKEILQSQITKRTVTTKKYLVFIFVCMLRALGLQCRVMFNFVTLPIKPPTSELLSLSTKTKEESNKTTSKVKSETKESKAKCTKSRSKKPTSQPIPQVDGNYDTTSDENEFENIMQVDGNDDTQVKTRSTRSTKTKTNANGTKENKTGEDDVSPPKIIKLTPKSVQSENKKSDKEEAPAKRRRTARKESSPQPDKCVKTDRQNSKESPRIITDPKALDKAKEPVPSPRKTRGSKTANKIEKENKTVESTSTITIPIKTQNIPKITITNEDGTSENSSKYFEKSDSVTNPTKKFSLSRKRSVTATPSIPQTSKAPAKIPTENTKTRTKSAPGISVETSKYFTSPNKVTSKHFDKKNTNTRQRRQKQDILEDAQRVSHRDISKPKPKNDVSGELVDIIKSRVKEAKQETKRKLVKGKDKKESDGESEYLYEEDPPKRRNADSDDEFKPTKISPKPAAKRKIDRRVLSVDSDELPKNKGDVWCEVFVEELEQWISVDVIRAKVHCTSEIYSRCTHPVTYIIGWDNNNNLKDLTRRYVPSWNTVTRKQRVEPSWWTKAIGPWLGPNNARDKEENEYLDRMQLEAPLPKSIAEYKNHPLYALKRHLLKFEALYPPDAATLGFVRGEAVYARECVYTCRSRDTWLKEAKTVRLGEKPYKVVKARPKWDKLSNKVISDLPLEVFGPWQVQDYEPPTAENGIVPRNAYGNVELFKDCMLPKGTVHIKLPGLNKVAKKLNIDCAPAMTGFDFNGGFTHPVFDGFVVCAEFGDILTEAWVTDQEEQEKRELEKLEAKVYGNWRRLIKGLLIRERLKDKYGFEEPSTSKDAKKNAKAPKLVVKKR